GEGSSPSAGVFKQHGVDEIAGVESRTSRPEPLRDVAGAQLNRPDLPPPPREESSTDAPDPRAQSVERAPQQPPKREVEQASENPSRTPVVQNRNDDRAGIEERAVAAETAPANENKSAAAASVPLQSEAAERAPDPSVSETEQFPAKPPPTPVADKR